MKKSSIMRQLTLLCAFVCTISSVHAWAQELIPATAISTMPVASVEDMSVGRQEFVVFNTVKASAIVQSDNNKRSRQIKEDKNEFSITYNIVKINGKRYLDYKDCEGVIRLGYLGGSNVYNSDADYMSAEEIVRRLAIYRLIGLAKEYGADALFEPTITTTVSSSKKQIVYNSEISAKLIKIKMD